jgi:replicative DNA helicase
VTDTTVPPQALEAEESILGAMLISPGAIGAVSEIVQPSDFYSLKHGQIYAAAVALYVKGHPVDAITLSDYLDELGELETIGGRVRLHELANLVPATANAAHYAKIVRETATLRGLIRAGGEISRLGWERPGETPELLEQAERMIYQLADARHSEAVSLPVEVKRVYEELMALDGKPRELLGVPSGLPDLDRVTRGFRPGDLIVIAADTGRGKSALWLNAALHLTVTRGLPVAAFSLEMSETELIQRALSLTAYVPHDRLTRGDMKVDEWRRAADAAGELVTAPLALWTDGLIRPAGVRSQLRRWKARNPTAALAVVDYLQLLTPDEKTDSRTADVSSISRALKVAAMDLHIPILAVSQLRRRLPNTRPHRNDLRESGSIENDASVVILIHHSEEEPGVAELIIAKNRHGAEASVKVKWTGEQMRFSPLVHEARAA